MISIHSETEFVLPNEVQVLNWVSKCIASEDAREGDINFIFCNDENLLEINKKYLNHDYYTDIITFDYSEGKILQGDIFISVDRVAENAQEYKVSKEQELLRVMIHGILHMVGFRDKSVSESALMRQKENEKLDMFHVKHS